MFTRSWKNRRWRVLGGIGLLIVALVLGCTPQKRYDTLSFFFDGVPSPDSSATTRKATRRTAGGRTVYIHQPFAEQKCNNCHQNTQDIFARARVKPTVCMDCHSSIKTEHKYMHGPVVNDVCITCHTPHQSVVQHLLRSEAPKLCTQCHDPAGLGPFPPEHLAPKSNCISCHSGHGGKDHNFLLMTQGTAVQQQPPSTAPTTREANR